MGDLFEDDDCEAPLGSIIVHDGEKNSKPPPTIIVPTPMSDIDWGDNAFRQVAMDYRFSAARPPKVELLRIRAILLEVMQSVICPKYEFTDARVSAGDQFHTNTCTLKNVNLMDIMALPRRKVVIVYF